MSQSNTPFVVIATGSIKPRDYGGGTAMEDQPSGATTQWTDQDAPRSMREFTRLTVPMIASIPEHRVKYVDQAIALYKAGDWYGADLLWLYVRPWVPEEIVHEVAIASLINAISTSQAESSSEASGHEGPASVVAEVPENSLVRASDGESRSDPQGEVL